MGFVTAINQHIYFISLGKGPKKNGHFMVFDHTLLTPPLKHIYGPLVANLKKKKSARNGTYNIRNGFLLKKKSILLANIQVRSLWKVVRPPSEAFYLN